MTIELLDKAPRGGPPVARGRAAHLVAANRLTVCG